MRWHRAGRVLTKSCLYPIFVRISRSSRPWPPLGRSVPRGPSPARASAHRREPRLGASPWRALRACHLHSGKGGVDGDGGVVRDVDGTHGTRRVTVTKFLGLRNWESEARTPQGTLRSHVAHTCGRPFLIVGSHGGRLVRFLGTTVAKQKEGGGGQGPDGEVVATGGVQK